MNEEEEHFAVLILAAAGVLQKVDSFPLTTPGPNLVQTMSRTQHFQSILLHNEIVLVLEHLDPAVETTSRQ